jgi:hypothetical protein
MRHGALALLLSMSASLPAFARAAGDRPSVASILARADQPDSPSPQLLAQDLIDLGTTSFPKAFEALELEAKRPNGLSSRRARVIYAACSIAGPARWRPIVEARAARGAPSTVFAAACAVCGACGTSSELEFLLHTAALDTDSTTRIHVERAITDILARDVAGFTVLDGLIGMVPADLRGPVATGVELTKKNEAAVLLSRWIGTNRDMRIVALPHLARLALALDKPIADEVLLPVRALLDQSEGECLPDAIVCAGRLNDYAAVPQLTHWLRDGDAGVKADALWSLRQISGLVLDEDPVLWQAWYAGESTWWEHDSRLAFDNLRSGTRIEKVEALRAIASLHAWREKLSDHVVVLLDDPDAELAGYGARMLGRLGSRASMGPLVEALSNAGCTDAAHDALEAISHKKLPSDPGACRDALGIAP